MIIFKSSECKHVSCLSQLRTNTRYSSGETKPGAGANEKGQECVDSDGILSGRQALQQRASIHVVAGRKE